MPQDSLSIGDAAKRIASLGQGVSDPPAERPIETPEAPQVPASDPKVREGGQSLPTPRGPRPDLQPVEDEPGEPEPELEGDDFTRSAMEALQDPPIEAPSSWSETDRAAFQSLPPEVRDILGRRERERDTELRQQQNDIATERQTFEKLRGEFDAEKQRLAERITPIIEAWEAEQGNVDARLNALLEAGDFEQWAKEKAYADARAKNLAEAKAQKDALDAQAQADQNARLAEIQQTERAKVMKAFPHWSDPKRQAADLEKMNAYGLARGFSAEELSQVVDSRYFEVLRDAAAFDALRRAKPGQTKRQPSQTRQVRPGIATGREEQRSEREGKALANLRKNPNSQDAAAAAIRARLAGGRS